MKKKLVLFDLDYTLFDTYKFKNSQFKDYEAYEEVMDVLSKLSNLVSLGIFSKGETNFQKTKLEKTKMNKFFKENRIHIFDDKDANLINVLKKYKGSKLFLVDDKLSVLYSAKRYMSQIITVWIKRGPYAQAQKSIKDFIPSATIDNLSDLYKIVLSN